LEKSRHILHERARQAKKEIAAGKSEPLDFNRL
jgi:hypothetical protein